MRTHRDERGAAAVEFALVLPVLLLLVIGIAEFGRAYSTASVLSGAAREGARTMALQNSTSAARSAAQAAAPGLALSSGQVAISPSACPAAGSGTTTLVTVTITYPMPFLTGFFGSSVTLHGKGVMRCNG